MHEAATICLCPSMPHAAAQHTLHLQRSACLASSSCGCHEYSQCMRQTDVVRRHQTSDMHHCLMPPPYQDGGIIIKFLWQAVLVSSISVDSVISFYVLLLLLLTLKCILSMEVPDVTVFFTGVSINCFICCFHCFR